MNGVRCVRASDVFTSCGETETDRNQFIVAERVYNYTHTNEQCKLIEWSSEIARFISFLFSFKTHFNE